MVSPGRGRGPPPALTLAPSARVPQAGGSGSAKAQLLRLRSITADSTGLGISNHAFDPRSLPSLAFDPFPASSRGQAGSAGDVSCSGESRRCSQRPRRGEASAGSAHLRVMSPAPFPPMGSQIRPPEGTCRGAGCGGPPGWFPPPFLGELCWEGEILPAAGERAGTLVPTRGSPGSHGSQLQPAAPQAVSWLGSPKCPKSRLLHVLCCFGTAEEPAPSSQSTQLSSSTRGLSGAPRGVSSPAGPGAGWSVLGSSVPRSVSGFSRSRDLEEGDPAGWGDLCGAGMEAASRGAPRASWMWCKRQRGAQGREARCIAAGRAHPNPAAGSRARSPAPGLGALCPPGDSSPRPGMPSTAPWGGRSSCQPSGC